ncbi:site-specific tyrosine recombinase XerD [Thermonema rossianum]|jgi:integrase/recombinase XerD|uniref:site-specific tyrosine recombinase XerD n=1 Tax=Thermonema rossianum TaxID=55505 RepID=UPI00068A5F14|nr:site-specific tyrosine recombinase XerD [Thermonema rossianum]
MTETLAKQWDLYIERFKNYLSAERALSANSVQAYVRDVRKLKAYAVEVLKPAAGPFSLHTEQLSGFLYYLNRELQVAERSQARILSGIKAFYRFLQLEDLISEDPAVLLEAPKLGRRLPDTLSVEEIDAILSAIDLSTDEGLRNRAMLEVLYSCGLRVSELIELKTGNLYWEIGFLKVIGKGDKERFVPIGSSARKYLKLYLDTVRKHVKEKKGHEEYVFLNRRGTKLTRVYVFTIIKELAKIAGIQKKVSPHTFRHSFATHLIEGGADLRAVQEMLGHESITTTEVYIHLDMDYLRDTVHRFHPRNQRQTGERTKKAD